MKKLTSLMLVSLAPISFFMGCGDDGEDPDVAMETGDNGETDTLDPAETDTQDPAETDTQDPEETGTPEDTTGGVEPADCLFDRECTDAMPCPINEETVLTGDVTLCSGVYALLIILEKTDGTLNIEPGTTILGADGTAVVIESGATINAVGTADEPIVLTALSESPTRGSWGGLVMAGLAPTNAGTGLDVEGFVNPPLYGGTDAAHNCGTLNYVRVEYAGSQDPNANDLNGIGFFGCGTDTNINWVQVSAGADDGVEMFGGSFDVQHLIVVGTSDDSIDIDQGYQGVIQYAFVQQSEGDGYALEFANNPDAQAMMPFSGGRLVNATVLGAVDTIGADFKEGTQIWISKSIFTGYTGTLFQVNGDQTVTNMMAGSLIRNNIFSGNAGTPLYTVADGTTLWDSAAFTAWVDGAANANENDYAIDPAFVEVAYGVTPDIAPSDAVALAAPLTTDGEETNYIGAVDPAADANWTVGAWTEYLPPVAPLPEAP